MTVKITRGKTASALLAAPAMVKAGLGTYQHVQEALCNMPAVEDTVSLEDFISMVKAAPIRNLSLASHRKEYLEYLAQVDTEQWPVHLRSIIQLQTRVKKHAELRLQRRPPVQAPSGDDGVPCEATSRLGDERAGDGQD